jgi:pyruvate/2-oxoglutarate dehydrogenase complex dihydrolipoamide acyltransferase (E2) component
MSTPEGDQDPQETLSPAVRRLVRQFDLDVTAIHGTGPSGRITVADVMSLLGGRTDSGKRDAPRRRTPQKDEEEHAADGTAPTAEAAAVGEIPATTVFDCDVSRVLAHRKRLRNENVEILTTSYFLAALATVLDTGSELVGPAPRFGVLLSTRDGEAHSALVDPARLTPAMALAERMRALDAELRASLDTDIAAADLLVHHYGEGGSVLTTPTPIGAGRAASVGIGRLRRELVVRAVDGVESPRVATHCYVTLSFLPSRIPFERANQWLAHAVRLLEQWPE